MFRARQNLGSKLNKSAGLLIDKINTSKAMSLTWSLLLSFGIVACGNEPQHINPVPNAITPSPSPTPAPTPIPEKTVAELETELVVALKKVSTTGDLNQFRLPASTDELTLVKQDPKNPLSPAKVALGKMLFNDPILLANPTLTVGAKASSCASCHAVEFAMGSGRRQSIGEGGLGYGLQRRPNPVYSPAQLDVQPVTAPKILNAGYQQLALWDGSLGGVGDNLNYVALWDTNTALNYNYLGYEGIEIQAIAGQDNHRLSPANIKSNVAYQTLFKAAYPGKASNVLITQETVGLAIAAYVRTLTTFKAPFQNFIRGQRDVLKASELRGALLFFGRANCIQCHAGPALNSMRFEAMGYGDLTGSDILRESPNSSKNLGRGGVTGRQVDMFKFKVPQLYNLKKAKFFGHGGSFQSVHDIVEYYNAGVPQNRNIPLFELSPFLKPLGLSSTDVDDITSFVEDGLLDADTDRYRPTTVTSGLCSPNADVESKTQLGCK